MKKFLFMDVDGVICLESGLSRRCVDNVKNLFSLVPDLALVLTSTRRADDNQCSQLKKILGVSDLYKTPLSHKSNRSAEIHEFLQKYSEPYSFAIVDDDINLYSYYFRELIICNRYEGFTEDVTYALYGILESNLAIK